MLTGEKRSPVARAIAAIGLCGRPLGGMGYIRGKLGRVNSGFIAARSTRWVAS